MRTVIEQFRHFVSTAARLLPRRQVPVSEFVAFASKATPLAVANVTKALPKLKEQAALASRWMTDHDLLDVAGLAYAENPYIELLAWALRQETHSASAVARQRGFILALSPR